MPRIHNDLHFIPADKIPLALQLLLDAGVITSSDRDLRSEDIKIYELKHPRIGAILKVKSYY